MIYKPLEIIYGLLLQSIAKVLIEIIRYSQFGEDEDII